ncbi:hypothetical protein Tco_0765262 [Tanacetum coccineum]
MVNIKRVMECNWLQMKPVKYNQQVNVSYPTKFSERFPESRFIQTHWKFSEKGGGGVMGKLGFPCLSLYRSPAVALKIVVDVLIVMVLVSTQDVDFGVVVGVG